MLTKRINPSCTKHTDKQASLRLRTGICGGHACSACVNCMFPCVTDVRDGKSKENCSKTCAQQCGYPS